MRTSLLMSPEVVSSFILEWSFVFVIMFRAVCYLFHTYMESAGSQKLQFITLVTASLKEKKTFKVTFSIPVPTKMGL